MFTGRRLTKFTVVTVCLAVFHGVRLASPCTKLVFYEISGKRGSGEVLAETNGTSLRHCLRWCRLTAVCHRFNFEGPDRSSGRCQLLIHFTVLTDDVTWSYYVNCPDGMEYYEETGSCYALTENGRTFEVGMEMCSAWAPGVHLVDIYSQIENDICLAYLNRTGGFRIVTAAWRPENDTSTSAYHWTSTGDQLVYSDWLPGTPSTYTDRQCVNLVTTDTDYGWINLSCLLNSYALCEV